MYLLSVTGQAFVLVFQINRLQNESRLLWVVFVLLVFCFHYWFHRSERKIHWNRMKTKHSNKATQNDVWECCRCLHFFQFFIFLRLFINVMILLKIFRTYLLNYERWRGLAMAQWNTFSVVHSLTHMINDSHENEWFWIKWKRMSSSHLFFLSWSIWFLEQNLRFVIWTHFPFRVLKMFSGFYLLVFWANRI